MVFTEVQRFSYLFDTGIACVLIAIIAFVWRYGNFDTPSTPKTRYARAVSKLPAVYFKRALSVFAVLLVCLCTFIIIEKQETRIDETGIHYRLFPVQLKEQSVPWQDVRYARVSRHVFFGYYKFPSFEYASPNGYGTGIFIVLNDGRQLIFGTRKPEEAASALREYGNNKR